MKLSTTEKNAVSFIIMLISILLGMGIYSQNNSDDISLDQVLGGMMGFVIGLFLTIQVPETYEGTMSGSKSVLKSSLVIALVTAFACAIYSSGTLAIYSIVFVVTPVIYDFSRGIFYPESTRDVPEQEQRTGMKILEILIEATMGAVIGIIITYAITGHF